MKSPPRILNYVPLQQTRLIHDIRGCVPIEFKWVAPQKRRERARTHPPFSCSHLPACSCLCNPAAFPLIILPADPCLMAVSGLQHHELFVLFNMTIKNDYKWSVWFQTESSKRLWCWLSYRRHPALLQLPLCSPLICPQGFRSDASSRKAPLWQWRAALCRAAGSQWSRISLLEVVSCFQ